MQQGSSQDDLIPPSPQLSSSTEERQPTSLFHQADTRSESSKYLFGNMSDSSDSSMGFNDSSSLSRRKRQLIYRLDPYQMRETRQMIDGIDYDYVRENNGLVSQIVMMGGRIPVFKHIWKKFFVPLIDVTSQVQLHPNEKIIMVTRPHFMLNVILLFLFGVLTISFFCFFPYVVMKKLWGAEDNLNRLFFWVSLGLYLFLFIYVLCYRLLFKRFSVRYILTDKRAIITGTQPQRSADRIAANDPVLQDDQRDGWTHNYTSYYYHNMSEIYFMLHQFFNPILHSESERNLPQMGTIFFGNRTENYLLPFSVLTYAKYTGFYKVRDVYQVLNIILTQCYQEGSTALQARLIHSEKELSTKLITKANALCGVGMSFCQSCLGGNRSLEPFGDL